jgi:hypothetical protein
MSRSRAAEPPELSSRSQSWLVVERVGEWIVRGIMVPLAGPAWIIEWGIRRRRPQFQFAIYNSIPYFATVSLLSTLAIVIGALPIAVVGLVLLVEMELVAVVVAIGVSLNPTSRYVTVVSTLARRHVRAGPRRALSGAATGAVVAFLYSIWFFCFLAMFVARFAAGQFSGLHSTSGPQLLWPCFYYSASTIASGSTGVTPTGAWAQAAALAESYVGLLFIAFVIAALAARLSS